MKNTSITGPEKRKKDFTRFQENLAAEFERFQAQASFAETLCLLHPDKAGEWAALIGRAEDLLEQACKGPVSGMAEGLKKAEALLSPLGPVAKSYTVHCVGHGHIDMNWMWGWPETVAVTRDTFSTVLNLMEEFPGFKFSQSQASVYRIMEEFHPDMLKRIAARVRQGRWEVTASHWVENEMNMADGESLCRHLLYARKYMKKLFGLKPEDVPICWSPDTFGHPATLPSFLSRGGVKYLYLHRPGGHVPSKPQAFWWKGPDGSRVLVRNDMLAGYNGTIRAAYFLDKLKVFAMETGLRELMFVYGVGDHGGGPTRRDITRIIGMDRWPVFPNMRFSTAAAYYSGLEKKAAKLPVLEGELNFEFAGCFTSQSLTKRGNRLGESRLMDAESSASLAWAAAKRSYPSVMLGERWKDVLFCQFHDILPGSGMHDTRTYAHGLFQNVAAAAASIETGALKAMASKMATDGLLRLLPKGMPPEAVSAGAGAGCRSAEGGLSVASQGGVDGLWPFVIFNPLAWERSETVEVTVWDRAMANVTTPFKERTFVARDADGRLITTQRLEDGHYWGHQFARLAFPVKVGAFGRALFVVVDEKAPVFKAEVRQLGREYHCSYASYEREPEGLENEFFSMELDMATGGIRSLTDKKTGVALISPDRPAPVLEYSVERPRPMNAWVIDHAGSPVPILVRSVERKGKGPCKCSIDVKFKVCESDGVLTYELRAGDPRLHIGLKCTWFQRGTPETGVPGLRMVFPLALEKARGRYEIPFAALDRPFNRGEEVAALRFAHVTGETAGGPAGVLLLNDCKYGHSLDNATLSLTLIRSSYDPDPLPEVRLHEARAALMAAGPGLAPAEAMRQGRNFNHELKVIATDVHPGESGLPEAGIRVEPSSVVLYSMKKAEEEEALVLKFIETEGKKAAARVELEPLVFGKVTAASEVDLLEQPVKGSAVRQKGNVLSLVMQPRSITSVRVALSPAGD